MPPSAIHNEGLLKSVATRLASDTQRQLHALRAGAQLLQRQDLLDLLQEQLAADEAVRMQLAFASTAHAADPAVRALLARLLTGSDGSAYVRQAVLRAIVGHEYEFLAEYLESGLAGAPDKGVTRTLLGLSANAYRSLRGDLGSAEPANPQLLQLLALLQSRRGEQAWQQIAMLQGLATMTRARGFVPAQLDGPPPIFADGEISDSDPLWDARLAARRAFTWPGDELAMGIAPLSPEQLQLMEQGQAFYTQCAACHGEDGKGIDGLAPALAGAEWVVGPPEWLGRIILQGMRGPVEVNGEVFDGVMPPHGHLAELDDATLAGLMTYLRRSWGNGADAVSAEFAAGLRRASAARSAPWTMEELRQVPYDRGFKRFEGKYSVSFVTLTVTAKPDGVHLSVPMYGAGIMEQINDTTFRAAAGGEDVQLEFVVEEDGSVDKLVMLREGEEITFKRKR